MNPEPSFPGSPQEFLASWSATRGNLRRFVEEHAGFGAALLAAEPMPNIPEMGAVWAPMGDALTVITDTEDSNPSEALSRAVDQILGR